MNFLKENQIKPKNWLTELARTVDFLWEKLHEYEADRKFKDEIIKNLCGQVSVLDLGRLAKNILSKLSSLSCDKR